ncbi:hypothetical protein C8Q74DRAFT_1373636 [Fomes fomentarius]|nr:hypothetical protein C8Q74DRAFT_1373636 [Fomes fomentarius]
MFTLPQPEASSSTSLEHASQVEECPFVVLDDSPEDLRHVLRAVLPTTQERFIYMGQIPLPTFDMISALARLGHKYQIDHLVQQVLDYLKEHFTTDLDTPCAHTRYVPENFDPIHTIGVVNIARLTDCTSILPTALTACCSLSVEQLFEGFTHKDGGSGRREDRRVLVGGFVCADGTREKLSEADLARCITGKIALLEELNAAVIRVCSTREPNAMTECKCERVKTDVLRFFAEGRLRGACDPFLDCDTYLRLEHRHGPRSTLNIPKLMNATYSSKMGREQFVVQPQTDGTPNEQDRDVTIKADEEFWLEDGTVVLMARNVQFKVYRGILSAHSLVFADMFSFPQPTAPSSENVDGCPVVHLVDSPEDLRHVLRAMIPRNGFVHVNSNSPPAYTYHELSAYIRLGHKYQIDALMDEALAYLKAHFSTKLSSWSALDYVPEPFDEVEAIGVVNIARLVGCTSMLPTAFLACCNFLDALGFKTEHGTFEKLSDDDLVRCTDAKRVLTRQLNTALLRACGICEHPGTQCERGMREVLRLYTENSDRWPLFDPFLDCNVYLRLNDTFGSRRSCVMCSTCQEQIKSRLVEEQRAIWKRLPEIFKVEVEGWDGE